MKNHKNAIKHIQATLKILAEKKRGIKQEILVLKQAGAETGPERDRLWNSYQWPHRVDARSAHLAIGILRGRSYASIEPKSSEPPLSARVLNQILTAFAEDPEQKALWNITRVRSWIQGEAEKALAA